MSAGCPFPRLNIGDKTERPADKSGSKTDQNGATEAVRKQVFVDESAPKCPAAYHEREQATEDPSVAPKCPFGYDSVSFKMGPLSCVICRALLYDSSRCVPCQHIFCRGCISRFQDCVICGADIDRIDADPQLQCLVERFIEGHARIKRPTVQAKAGLFAAPESPTSNVVSYEDASLARGSFLIQQALRVGSGVSMYAKHHKHKGYVMVVTNVEQIMGCVRSIAAFQAQNFDSAKSRLQLCAEDTREELSRSGNSTEICSQFGAVLGMLGDCCRSMGDAEGGMSFYEESVQLLLNLPQKDEEVVHALSVSLNKLGDLKYYAEDLVAARKYYCRSLKLRKRTTDLTKLSSQVLDVAVSLAKVADVNRGLGNKGPATEGFQEALKMLQGLSSPKTKDGSLLEARRLSVLEFLHNQLAADHV